MKEIELKILSELMKNSRRSDRELAKAIGTSQPTVSRTIKKLTEEGYIKEFTIIPDFKKLGYKLMALTLVKFKNQLAERQEIEGSLKKALSKIIMFEKGLGLGFDAAIISYHENYFSFSKFLEWLKYSASLEVSDVQTFLISLDDKERYCPLSFQAIAAHLSMLKKKMRK